MWLACVSVSIQLNCVASPLSSDVGVPCGLSHVSVSLFDSTDELQSMHMEGPLGGTGIIDLQHWKLSVGLRNHFFRICL